MWSWRREGNAPSQIQKESFWKVTSPQPFLPIPIEGQFWDGRRICAALIWAYMETYFRTTHTQNNTVIAVVGDIQASAILKIAERYFGRIPPRRLASPFITESIHAVNGLSGARYPNQFVLFAAPRHPHSCAELEQAIDHEIEKLKQESASDRELQKVKNQIRADFIRGLDSYTGLASMLSYYEILLRDFHYLIDYTDTIGRITSEDILQAAQTYLIKGNRTIATLLKPLNNINNDNQTHF
jgi:predicted Zn-dependent peptidase